MKLLKSVFARFKGEWLKAIAVITVSFIALIVFLPPELLTKMANLVRGTSPVFIAVALFILFYDQWIKYTRMKFHGEVPTTLLEIKLPAEITQSPLAMETVLSTIYQSGDVDNRIDAYFRGRTRPWFSLEIVSLEGQVHFYIWTRAKYKNFIESQLYAQYPEVEVYEVPDYTTLIPFDLKKMKCWGIEMKLHKPNPYPIKTYIDFGLDAEQKEEFKVDPLSSLLEFLGGFGKGEYGWIQLIIRAHEAYPTFFLGYPKEGLRVHWKDQAKHEVEKILEKLKKSGDEQGITFARIPTKGEADMISAIQKNVNKKAYELGIRAMYVARLENYNSTRHVGFPSSFRAFETHELNGFKPVFLLNFRYPWWDFKDIRRHHKMHHMYEAYRNRGYYFYPFREHHVMVKSVEEIATVYHFPGRVTRTPTLERMASKKSEAPSNIPI